MADIKTSALSELTVPADGDMFSVYDVSETVSEKTKRILFSTLRKSALCDADLDTKITMDNSADEDTIRFYTGSGGEQLQLSDGSLIPTKDDDIWLGNPTNQFSVIHAKNFYNVGGFFTTFPTLNSNAKFMLGAAGVTMSWFYNNLAPPGWVVAITSDHVVRVGATGGITGGSWVVSGLTGASTTGNDTNWSAGVIAGTSGETATTVHQHPISTTITSDGSWRPLGVIGKICRLDS